MVVRGFDSALRYTVSSQTVHELEYLVDLGAYWLNGQCSCMDFTCRHEPILTRGGPRVEPSDATRCKHIRVARECVLDYLLRELSRNEAKAAGKKPEPRVGSHVQAG
jgi:hypothetical protein